MLARSASASKYQVTEKLIGRGSYGAVYKGKNTLTNKAVAVKKLKNFTNNALFAKRLFREIAILRTLKEHPNIISLEYIVALSTNEIHLVFECYDTDLYKVIRSSQPLSKQHKQHFLYQIVNGIYYMHSAGVVHRDLKPANILVNLNGNIVICDLGLARAIQEIRETNQHVPPRSFRQLTDYVVTRWYRCPELLLEDSRGGKVPADMWSIGCILAELFLRTPLFPGKNSLDQLNLIFDCIGTPKSENCLWIDNRASLQSLEAYPHKPRQNFHEKFKHEDESALDLLEKLLEFDPSKRMTAEQALQHPFLDSLSTNPPPITRFSLECKSPVDKSSLTDYIQFEAELDSPESCKSSPKIAQLACSLIQKEVARYISPPTFPVISSAKALSSFFYNPPVNSRVNATVVSNSDTSQSQLEEPVVSATNKEKNSTTKRAIGTSSVLATEFSPKKNCAQRVPIQDPQEEMAWVNSW